MTEKRNLIKKCPTTSLTNWSRPKCYLYIYRFEDRVLEKLVVVQLLKNSLPFFFRNLKDIIASDPALEMGRCMPVYHTGTSCSWFQLALINRPIYCIHFLTVYPCFAFKKCTGTSKFQFWALLRFISWGRWIQSTLSLSTSSLYCPTYAQVYLVVSSSCGLQPKFYTHFSFFPDLHISLISPLSLIFPANSI
jgi:hypothetical protein